MKAEATVVFRPKLKVWAERCRETTTARPIASVTYDTTGNTISWLFFFPCALVPPRACVVSESLLPYNDFPLIYRNLPLKSSSVALFLSIAARRWLIGPRGVSIKFFLSRGVCWFGVGIWMPQRIGSALPPCSLVNIIKFKSSSDVHGGALSCHLPLEALFVRPSRAKKKI